MTAPVFNPKHHVHKSNLKDFESLVRLINELEKLSFSKRVQAKHYLSNILENVQPRVLTQDPGASSTNVNL